MKLTVDIRKKFKDFELCVDFEAGNGVFGLLGPSGCGKSLTLRCIAGIERPDSGIIRLDDKVLFDSSAGIDLSPQKRRVGYLFQSYALFPNMTLEQNISASPCGKKNCSEYISLFYLNGLEKHYPHELSGGQKQRAALARMLAAEPEMVMLDEPFSSLDRDLRLRLEGKIAEISRDFGGTVLFVSHDMDEVFRLSDKVAVIENGRIVDTAPKRELFEKPNTVASARLTGCMNISSLVCDEQGVFASDWGITLPCGHNVGYGYVGCRAQYFEICSEKNGADVFECEIVRITENMFSYTVFFRNKGYISEGEGHTLVFETDKDTWHKLDKEKLFLRPVHEKLFYMVK